MEQERCRELLPALHRIDHVANTDVAGITQQGYTNQMGQYNAKQAQANLLPSMIGTLGGAALGNSALGAKAMSFLPSGAYGGGK